MWPLLHTIAACALVSDADLMDRFDVDGDGVSRPDDCDDDDKHVGQEVDWFADQDGDGFGSGEPSARCVGGEGFSAVDGDCDEGDQYAYPGAPEICDGIDEDCDGVVDEDARDATPWYPDVDGDGFGDPTGVVIACTPPDGFIADNMDCDDTCDTCFTGAVEACGDAVDNDCDGVTAGECALSGEIRVDNDAAVTLLEPVPGSHMGAWVVSAGDTDGDGKDDLFLGADAGAA